MTNILINQFEEMQQDYEVFDLGLENPVLNSKEFINCMDLEINKRISKGVKQAMDMVQKKLDGLLDMRLITLTKELEQRQDIFEGKLVTKIMDLKREFRSIQLKRDSFYK